MSLIVGHITEMTLTLANYGKCLRKLLEANNETYFVIQLLHSFIRSIVARLLRNYGKPILLKMTKNRKHHLWNARKITHHRTQELWFHTLREACHYQREFGGRICATQQEVEKEETHMQYLLHLKHHQRLRGIKELLLQYHNFFNV